MVLAKKQKHGSMEQNGKPRDKSTHLWTPYLTEPIASVPADAAGGVPGLHRVEQGSALRFVRFWEGRDAGKHIKSRAAT